MTVTNAPSYSSPVIRSLRRQMHWIRNGMGFFDCPMPRNPRRSHSGSRLSSSAQQRTMAEEISPTVLPEGGDSSAAPRDEKAAVFKRRLAGCGVCCLCCTVVPILAVYFFVLPGEPETAVLYEDGSVPSAAKGERPSVGTFNSAVYSGEGAPGIPVSQYPPAVSQYPSILGRPNFGGLVLGCIEADFCY